MNKFVRVGKNEFIGGMEEVVREIINYGMEIGVKENMGGIKIIGMKS